MSPELLIVQRRFIAMVTVRDEKRLAVHRSGDLLKDSLIGYGPQAFATTRVVLEVVTRRRAFYCRFQKLDDGTERIGVEGPDRAEV